MRIVSAHADSTPAAADLIPAPYLGALSAYAGAHLSGFLRAPDAIRLLDGAFLGQEPFSPSGGLDLADWLERLGAIGSPCINLLLPASGRIGGLVGPPSATQTALRSGQALVVTEGSLAAHTVLADPPRHAGSTWLRLVTAEAPEPRPVPILAGHASGTREDLYRYLDEAHSYFQGHDLVPDEPIRAGALPEGWLLMEPPTGMHATHAHTARLAGRLVVLASAAFDSDGISPQAQTALAGLLEQARQTLQSSLSYASTGLAMPRALSQ